jgi:hypothetical protein
MLTETEQSTFEELVADLWPRCRSKQCRIGHDHRAYWIATHSCGHNTLGCHTAYQAWTSLNAADNWVWNCATCGHDGYTVSIEPLGT